MSFAARQSSSELFEEASRNAFFTQNQEKIQRRLYELVLIFKGAGEHFSYKEKDHVLKTLCRFVAKGLNNNFFHDALKAIFNFDIIRLFKIEENFHEREFVISANIFLYQIFRAIV